MMRLQAILVGVMVATGATAGSNNALQLSLTPGIAIHDRNEVVRGVTIGAWSENPQVALALGIVIGSTGESAGLSMALLLNYAVSYKGVLLAPVNSVRRDFAGWQGGCVNCAWRSMKGLQTGAVNYAGHANGLQMGVVNCAERLTGLQLGLVNYAANAGAGLQIGFVNMIPRNQWFPGLADGLAPVMVSFNWKF